MAKPLLESVQCQACRTTLAADETVEITKEHVVDGSEEALNASAATWLAWNRKHQTHLMIGSNLQVPGCEVSAVVCV